MLYENLNQRKKELGLTTEQLSRLSGVPVGTINKILSGETRSPRYDTLRALEDVLYGADGIGNPEPDSGRSIYDTVYDRTDSLWVKAAMRHTGICRMLSEKLPPRTLQSGRANTP